MTKSRRRHPSQNSWAACAQPLPRDKGGHLQEEDTTQHQLLSCGQKQLQAVDMTEALEVQNTE